MTQHPKLLDRYRAALRVRHYSVRTEESYVAWVRRFILHHGKKHPAAMGSDEVNAFLSSLAIDGHVSASTQNQALAAILFLYRVVLEDPLPWLGELVRARKSVRVPVVLTPAEARAVIDAVEGVSQLVAKLLYGSGLRLLESLRLRVKDVDFARHELLVRDPKGRRDRVTTLPQTVESELHIHLEGTRLLHQSDLRMGYGSVALPRRSIASFEMPLEIGFGNGYFRPPRVTSIRVVGLSAGITYTNRRFKRRCMRRRFGCRCRSV